MGFTLTTYRDHIQRVSSVVPWFEFDPTDYATLQAIWDDANLYNMSTTNSKILETGLTTSWGGTKAVKVTMDSGQGAGGIRAFFPGASTDQPREIWMEWYVKFSDNWKTNWEGGGNPDHKTWLFYDQRNTGTTRWSYKIGNFGHDISIYTVWTEGATIAASGYPTPLTTYVWNDEWHRLRIYAEMNGEAADSYASLHAWFNDTKIQDINPDDVKRNSSQQNTDYFNSIRLSDVVNQTPTETVHYWIGRHRAWITNPGW